jgi:hypothetical protein
VHVIRSALLVLALALAWPVGGVSARSGLLVSYTRSGGFIGVRDVLTVRADGQASADGRVFRLGPRRLAALQAALREARFATLARKYLPEAPFSDGYTWTVSHAGKTVLVAEGGSPPRRLQRLLDVLADIHARR